MKIKICGIRNEAEAKIINETCPDFMGFVFAKSKRQVDFSTAKKLSSIINPKIKKVGVFVDENEDFILNLYKNKIIDIAQLHGEYSEEFVEKIKSSGLFVIKVIRVQKNVYEINTKADFVLFDSFSKEGYGGQNLRFSLDVKIQSNVPYFIAGGLNEQNVLEAIKKFRPWGVDISSGAEENGFKTKEKVSNIIKIVKEGSIL